MSNNAIAFTLSQITPPSAPAARELSYGNLAKAIERFEYGMSSNVRVLQSKRTRFNNHSHMTMMTKENSNPKLAKLGRPEAAGYATLSLSLSHQLIWLELIFALCVLRLVRPAALVTIRDIV